MPDPVAAESRNRVNPDNKNDTNATSIEKANAYHTTWWENWQYHCNTIPTISGTRNRMKGALFQIATRLATIYKSYTFHILDIAAFAAIILLLKQARLGKKPLAARIFNF